MVSCPNCGNELPDEAKFCYKCGASVPVSSEKKPIFCTWCGFPWPEDGQFCMHCGKRLGEWLTPKEDVKQELKTHATLAPQYYEYGIIDIVKDEYQIRDRPRKWAEYFISCQHRIDWYELLFRDGALRSALDHLWFEESIMFPTNKPKAYKLHFMQVLYDEIKRMIQYAYISEDNTARLVYYDVIAHLKDKWELDLEPGEFIDGYEKLHFTPLEFKDLEKEVKEEERLFFSPEPIRAEVPGRVILNFMSDEAALAVYMDSLYEGQEVVLTGSSVEGGNASWVDMKTSIIERTDGNIPLGVAIFSNIPFATNRHKHYGEFLQRIECIVTFTSYTPILKLTQKVTLFRGNVTEVDWRGKK